MPFIAPALLAIAFLSSSLFGFQHLQPTELALGAAPLFTVPQGGTGSSTLTGLIKGNGTSAVRTAVAGTDYQAPISLTTTGSSGAASFSNNTLNIPQYSGGASSTLLGDNNTFSGNNTFSNIITGSISGNAGTASALAGNGTNCNAGSYARGVDASGNAENCTADSDTTYTGTYPIILTGTTFSFPATSTLFGSGTQGQVLGWDGSKVTWVATSTCIEITGSAALCDGNDATSGGGSGALATSTNEVANQVAVFTSNSATPALIGGDSDFTFSGNKLTATYASSTGFSSSYASSTSGFFGSLSIGALSGFLKATAGAVSTALIGVADLASTDFGDFTCNGSACTNDADSIALTTDTTGNYVKSIADAGNSTITVVNGNTEGGAVTLDAVDVNCTGCIGATEVAGLGTADISGLDISDDTNLAATWPVILTGDTLSFGGLSTSSAIAAGANVLYATGVNTLASAATGTVSCTGNIACTNFFGIGGASSISFTGDLPFANLTQGAANTVLANQTSGTADFAAISTTSIYAGTSGQVLAKTASGWVGVATSTDSCSSGISCSYSGGTNSFTNTGVTSNVAGAGISVSGATGAVTITNTIGYPFPSNATSTALTFTGLQTISNSSTTLASFSYASSTLWYGGGLQACDPTTGKLTWSNGQFSCGTDQTGGAGGSFPFAADTNFAQTVYSTSTPTLWFKSGLFASSTSWFTNTITTDATSTNATTTNLYASGQTRLASLSGVLKATTGVVSTGADGTDYTLVDANTCSTNQALLSVTAAGVFTCGTVASTTLLANNNTFSGTNMFTGASTTFVGGVTIGNATTTNATSTNLYASGQTRIASLSGLLLGSTGVVSAITTGTIGSTGVLGISGGVPAYVATSTLYGAGGIPNAALLNSTISGIALGSNLGDLTATNGTLTFSGTYNGSSARNIGLNLGNANIWTALQTFSAAASSTQISAATGFFNNVIASSSLATSTFAGGFGVGTSTPWRNFSVVGNSIFKGATAATSTVYVSSTGAGLGGRIILEDIDAAGCTEITALDGVLTAKTVTCP